MRFVEYMNRDILARIYKWIDDFCGHGQYFDCYWRNWIGTNWTQDEVLKNSLGEQFKEKELHRFVMPDELFSFHLSETRSIIGLKKI